MLMNMLGIFGGDLPPGFKAIATGTKTLTADQLGNVAINIEHNLGVVPDMVLFYHEGRTQFTNAYEGVAWCNQWTWKDGNYHGFEFHHGSTYTSISTATFADTDSTGVYKLDDAEAEFKFTSASVTWKAQTYKWLVIKFDEE